MLDTRHWTAGARAGCGGCWVWWLLGVVVAGCGGCWVWWLLGVVVAGCGGCWVWWLLGAGGSIYSSKYAFVFTPFVLLF